MSEYFEKGRRGVGRSAGRRELGDGRSGRLLKAEGKEIEESPMSAENLGRLVGLIAQGKITGKLAKEIFPKMFADERTAGSDYAARRAKQISDEGALGKIIDEVIAANPKQVEQYRRRQNEVIGFLVGQVMKASRGQADPAVVTKLLQRNLETF